MRNTALLLLAISIAVSAAHDGDDSIEAIHSNPWEYIGIPVPLDVLMVSAVISGLAVFYSIFVKGMSEDAKRAVFFIIGAPIAISTAYLMISTVVLNLASETGGPVHWHADYEVWACGEKFELIDPTGLDNKVGSPVLHEHNDNRIHVEGVLLKREEASLRNFFIQVGGNFDEDSLTMPTNDEVRTWNNGDKCSNLPAKWYVFVNGTLLDPATAHDYVMSPLTIDSPNYKIDRIKLVFTEKNPTTVNPDIGGPP